MKSRFFRQFKMALLDEAAGGGAADGKEGNNDRGSAGADEKSGEDGAGGTEVHGDEEGNESNGRVWMDGLSSELRGEASLGKFKTVEDLAAGYVSASKMIGVDTMRAPNAKTTDEEKRTILSKMGLPEKAEDYGINRGDDSAIDEQFHSDLVSKSHELGLLPSQVKGIVDMFEQSTSSANKAVLDAKAASEAEGEKSLREEWGEAFDRKLQAANFTLSEFGGKELVQHINELGLGNDPKLIKMLAEVGEAKSDDVFKGDSKKAFGISPEEAQDKISEMLGATDSPLHDLSHPEHDKYQKEYNRLGALAYKK